MTMSAQQRRVRELLDAGYTMRILRSPLSGAPTCVEVVPPDGKDRIDLIEWWRVERFVASGHFCFDNRNLTRATKMMVDPSSDFRSRRRVAVAV